MDTEMWDITEESSQTTKAKEIQILDNKGKGNEADVTTTTDVDEFNKSVNVSNQENNNNLNVDKLTTTNDDTENALPIYSYDQNTIPFISNESTVGMFTKKTKENSNNQKDNNTDYIKEYDSIAIKENVASRDLQDLTTTVPANTQSRNELNGRGNEFTSGNELSNALLSTTTTFLSAVIDTSKTNVTPDKRQNPVDINSTELLLSENKQLKPQTNDIGLPTTTTSTTLIYSTSSLKVSQQTLTLQTRENASELWINQNSVHSYKTALILAPIFVAVVFLFGVVMFLMLKKKTSSKNRAILKSTSHQLSPDGSPKEDTVLLKANNSQVDDLYAKVDLRKKYRDKQLKEKNAKSLVSCENPSTGRKKINFPLHEALKRKKNKDECKEGPIIIGEENVYNALIGNNIDILQDLNDNFTRKSENCEEAHPLLEVSFSEGLHNKGLEKHARNNSVSSSVTTLCANEKELKQDNPSSEIGQTEVNSCPCDQPYANVTKCDTIGNENTNQTVLYANVHSSNDNSEMAIGNINEECVPDNLTPEYAKINKVNCSYTADDNKLFEKESLRISDVTYDSVPSDNYCLDNESFDPMNSAYNHTYDCVPPRQVLPKDLGCLDEHNISNHTYDCVPSQRQSSLSNGTDESGNIYSSVYEFPDNATENILSNVNNDGEYNMVADHLSPSEGGVEESPQTSPGVFDNHHYDPVYIPSSDAQAMLQRLDNYGYVRSRMPLRLHRMYEEISYADLALLRRAPRPALLMGASASSGVPRMRPLSLGSNPARSAPSNSSDHSLNSLIPAPSDRSSLSSIAEHAVELPHTYERVVSTTLSDSPPVPTRKASVNPVCCDNQNGDDVCDATTKPPLPPRIPQTPEHTRNAFVSSSDSLTPVDSEYAIHNDLDIDIDIPSKVDSNTDENNARYSHASSMYETLDMV